MPSSSPSNTTTSIQQEFERNGFVGPLDILLTREQTQSALEEVQKELSRPNANKNDRFKLHLILPALSEIAHHPTLVTAVQQALNNNPNILLWSSDINIKLPNSSKFFAPHQDATYAGLQPSAQCVTVWVALSDPVGELEGCLSFYPQSHSLGQLPHDIHPNDGNNLLSLGQYIAPAHLKQLKQQPISIPLRGGQATLHSFDCVHFSGPNTSTRPRVGLALRYMTADVVQSKTHAKEMVTWISGRSTDIHLFDLEPRLPAADATAQDIARGREAREEAMRREEANYFAETDCKE
jgi:ectoine hydroxylase-related dioxygenase (phytanoyl-CoA dioxygenase family)